MRIEEHDGQFVIYHRDEAGNPGAHTDPGGPWYFEPVSDWDSGDVFSPGFATADAARAAARDWFAEEAWRAASEGEGERGRIA